MASGFPGAIDNFSDPLANSPLNSPSHATLHSDVNDAVEKIETYMGLVKVIPTGATNGTVGADGTVTVGNAVSSVTVSGAFSSLYNNYRITVNGVDCSNAGGAAMRFRFGTTATGYYGSQLYDLATGAATGYNRENNGTSAICGMQDTENFNTAFDVFSPNLALRSSMSGTSQGAQYFNSFGFYVDNSTQYTSFQVITGTGTMTGGSIRIYGYRN